jgi:hypothetical protein
VNGVTTKEEAPPAVVGPIPLPPEVVEALVAYGLQTALGQALWRGYLLGAGLPKGDGGIEVRSAVYLPKPGPA